MLNSMYNPKEYWRKELGGVESWKHHADTSLDIMKSIDRLKTVVIPKIVELIKSKGGNILDAGCGSGFCINEFKNYGAWDGYYGIDFHEHRIEYCNNRYNNSGIDFSLGNLIKLPYENSFFNVIYTGAVLMHLPVNDKINAINEFKRVLTEDGIYFGHEVIQKTNNDVIDSGYHVINPNISWLRKQFYPLKVDELVLHHDDYDFQIIYAHK
jgi:ubiquinone/menaquinone biosynthesis C-methylase UbiE